MAQISLPPILWTLKILWNSIRKNSIVSRTLPKISDSPALYVVFVKDLPINQSELSVHVSFLLQYLLSRPSDVTAIWLFSDHLDLEALDLYFISNKSHPGSACYGILLR